MLLLQYHYFPMSKLQEFVSSFCWYERLTVCYHALSAVSRKLLLSGMDYIIPLALDTFTSEPDKHCFFFVLFLFLFVCLFFILFLCLFVCVCFFGANFELCTWSTTGSSAPLRGRSTCGVSALGRGESTFGSTAPGRGNDFLLYIGEKMFCPRARRIHLWIYRARARKRFSSLYRGENFLRSGAENPPLDLPRPGAETIFFSI